MKDFVNKISDFMSTTKGKYISYATIGAAIGAVVGSVICKLINKDTK